MAAPAPTDTWVYVSHHGVYYHTPSNTYAILDPRTGQWSYLPAQSFPSAGPSQTSAQTSQVAVLQAVPTAEVGKEDGEVNDDVGWGGLMDPEKLEAVIKSKSTPAEVEKHPAYQTYRKEPTPPPKINPSHILRLVVGKSEVMPVGGVVVVDAREGGVQIGRDRCERGGQVRLRVKEMEVSKTHGVVYWGRGEDEKGKEVDGWWVVDLGEWRFLPFLILIDERVRVDTWDFWYDSITTRSWGRTILTYSLVRNETFLPPTSLTTPLHPDDRRDNPQRPHPPILAMRSLPTSRR